MTAGLAPTGTEDAPLRGRAKPSRAAAPRAVSKRSVGRPRGSNTDVRRQMIVSSAMRIFAYRGYDAATLQEVADLVGITRPAVHHHFPGKAPLYRSALDRAYELVMTTFAVHPLEAITAPPQGELRMASALLGTSLAQSHRIADIAPRITSISADLRRLCHKAAGPDADQHRTDLLVAVVVGRWVLTASDLSRDDIDADFDLA
ncbi:TetR/AcrR family transcriptional regulator [Mycolicibacterium sphagni]|uniref:TetR/AcrR family transcriptional regulator n=1 Tax=Mycolicibacterium sphagni TaxID=1786 RepID=UPI001056170B|nr:TetR/AcrR family transcriptional regulator [Mycolicibacterium sphagni]MCV7177611.1 TetR/AcrR family transcriptional regulator [Mycolicibacterium sphagni]